MSNSTNVIPIAFTIFASLSFLKTSKSISRQLSFKEKTVPSVVFSEFEK